jgi:NAD(P)-dependent dehydrogenase (short-subunit alcohol dehydrogenase family)
MDLGLKDKVAVVTGGTSGIGLETARLLLGEGARVAICGRDEGRLTDAVAGLGGGGRLLGVACDVLDKASVTAFAQKVSAWSGGSLDVLVNNAGQGRVSTFAETTDEAWREELELKFFSQVNPLRAFLPQLKASDAAAVVIVNSLLALQPEPHMVATSAARAGVQNLAKSLAVELAPAIRVNTILLGLVISGQWRRRFEARPDKTVGWDDFFAALAKTKGIPLARLGLPEEAARAIVWLGSPAASYVTGANIEVSGGVSRFI